MAPKNNSQDDLTLARGSITVAQGTIRRLEASNARRQRDLDAICDELSAMKRDRGEARRQLGRALNERNAAQAEVKRLTEETPADDLTLAREEIAGLNARVAELFQQVEDLKHVRTTVEDLQQAFADELERVSPGNFTPYHSTHILPSKACHKCHVALFADKS